MSGNIRKFIRYTVSAALGGLTVFLGYYVQRSEFGWLLATYAVFFGLYLYLVFNQKSLSEGDFKRYLALGILLRFLLLFSIPNLSDDFYRFLWDGHLTLAGIHPFSHPPTYFIGQQIPVPGLTPELYARLNSPNYFTVYPPLCQAIFALAVWVAPHSLWGEVVVMKSFLFAGELGSLWLLYRWDSGQKHKVLLYALNPLLIIEIVGNCHFEGLMIFFLLAGWRMLQQNRLTAASGLWGLATAAKLLPPLFLPLVWRWLGWRQGWRFMLFFAGFCVLLFLPLLDMQVLTNMSQSLELYFQRFEFNASLYYLAQAVGHWQTGYYYIKIVGPLLALVTLSGTLWLTYRTQREEAFSSTKHEASSPLPASGHPLQRGTGCDPGFYYQDHPSKNHPNINGLSLPTAMLWAVFLYLSCATTIHPWYATVPLALSLLTGWRFPILWSGLIILSYSHYANGGSTENFWLIGLEYGLLWLFILGEILVRRQSQSILEQ